MDTFSEVVDSEEVGVVLEESSNVGQRYHSCWDCNHIEDSARYNWAGKEKRGEKDVWKSRSFLFRMLADVAQVPQASV